MPMFQPPHAMSMAITRPAVGPRISPERLEASLDTWLSGLNVGYFLLMWLVTAYEAAMMAGVPILYPAVQSGLMPPDAAFMLYETAARGHVYLLPAVTWFLIYQGLPALTRR